MQYLSLAFAGFVAVLLPLYYALPRRWNLRWGCCWQAVCFSTAALG